MAKLEKVTGTGLEERLVLSVKETAKLMGISVPVAYDLVHSPGFPSFTVGGRILVNKKRLQNWLDAQTGYTEKGNENVL